MELNDGQLDAISKITDFLCSPRKVFRVSGYAGTGKTTIIREIVDEATNIPVAAFMGKAADVLRKKGLPGQTIHSLIYEWDMNHRRFFKRQSLGNIDYIVVDEGSMIGGKLWRDLTSFGKKVLVFGDGAQLEPVDDDDPKLMHSPDVQLTEIHRQAKDNPIINLATDIREGRDYSGWHGMLRSMRELTPDVLLIPDIWLCGFNKTRVNMNKEIRRLKGYDRWTFASGDRLKCTTNDESLGVFNGSMFTVVESLNCPPKVKAVNVPVIFDGEKDVCIVSLAVANLNMEKNIGFNESLGYSGKSILCEYSYAITVHASQGSEYPVVGIVDQQCDLWSPDRHRYTAVTRASERILAYGDMT